jgi:GntR family transcriptional regulator/MocR family aminotransferase
MVQIMISYPYLSTIQPDKSKASPLYLQIAQGLSGLMKQGILKPGQKLPGSRILAEKLQVNRNTVVLAVDELLAEAWVVARPRSGLYVNEKLPLVERVGMGGAAAPSFQATGFLLESNLLLEAPELQHFPLQFNDGVPDPRLSPLHELGREYHRLLKKTNPLQLFSYSEAQGDEFFRKVLCKDLNEHRGLKLKPDQIFISRGSVMGIYLIARTTLKAGDAVVVGELNYRTANLCFEQAGARLHRIPIDEKGMDTAVLAALLEKQKVRMVYITSHHHHPTTVSLSAERRLHLYELAKKWNFIILEDDYDFDYHYDNKPTLPIASMDSHGLVIYIGSYSKIIYPGIRIGFIASAAAAESAATGVAGSVTPTALMHELVKYRRIVDRQGDHVMERAIAHMVQEGSLQRYLRKSKKVYKKRKEFFCRQLRDRFTRYLDFQEPEGGMAVWVIFKEAFPLEEISRRCAAKGLYLSNGRAYNPPGRHINACRMGFAAMREEEIGKACNILEEVLEGFRQE